MPPVTKSVPPVAAKPAAKPAAAKPLPPPPAPKPAPAASAVPGEKPAHRVVVYPECFVEFHVSPERKLGQGMIRKAPVGVDYVKQLMGWESEGDYSKRRAAETGQPEAKCKFPDDMEVVPFEDVNGERVVCWHNHHNRPFDREHALELAQDQLHRVWRFNMENFIVSKYGTVLSAQHRGIALVFAHQMLNGPQKLKWRAIYGQGPITIETTIAFGADETPEVLMSFDNTKPRGPSDVIYTSPLFSDLNHAERKECSRMEAKAVDLLWRRTAAGKGADSDHKYLTNSTVMDFLDRHKRLVECVRHLFNSNKERGISVLKLSPGQCAAMMYMMAAGKTDGDLYSNSAKAPCEEYIDFELWEDAQAFWSDLAKAESALKPLQEGLKLLVDPDEGLGGRLVEKIALIALAWRTWLESGHNLTEDDVLVKTADGVRPALEYSEDRTKLLNAYDFAGIDKGYVAPKSDPPAPTPEELEERKAAEREATAKKQQEMVAAKKQGKVPAVAQAEADKRNAAIAEERRRLSMGSNPVAPAPTAAKPPVRKK